MPSPHCFFYNPLYEIVDIFGKADDVATIFIIIYNWLYRKIFSILSFDIYRIYLGISSSINVWMGQLTKIINPKMMKKFVILIAISVYWITVRKKETIEFNVFSSTQAQIKLNIARRYLELWSPKSNTHHHIFYYKLLPQSNQHIDNVISCWRCCCYQIYNEKCF